MGGRGACADLCHGADVQLVEEHTSDDPDFTSDVHLFDYGYLDSFGAQQLITHLESTYHIKISDNDLVKYPLNTLTEISKFVVDRQRGAR